MVDDSMIVLPPQITPRTRRALSSFVIAKIEAEGIRVPDSSRLRRMHDLLHSGRGPLETTDPDLEIALEGERDLQLLAFAFDQLSPIRSSDTYRGLLKKVVRDSVLPQNDRKNSKGRDAAFEIHVAGVCAAAQLFASPIRGTGCHLYPRWQEIRTRCEKNQKYR